MSGSRTLGRAGGSGVVLLYFTSAPQISKISISPFDITFPDGSQQVVAPGYQGEVITLDISGNPIGVTNNTVKTIQTCSLDKGVWFLEGQIGMTTSAVPAATNYVKLGFNIFTNVFDGSGNYPTTEYALSTNTSASKLKHFRITGIINKTSNSTTPIYLILQYAIASGTVTLDYSDLKYTRIA